MYFSALNFDQGYFSSLLQERELAEDEIDGTYIYTLLILYYLCLYHGLG